GGCGAVVVWSVVVADDDRGWWVSTVCGSAPFSCKTGSYCCDPLLPLAFFPSPARGRGRSAAPTSALAAIGKFDTPAKFERHCGLRMTGLEKIDSLSLKANSASTQDFAHAFGLHSLSEI